VSLNCHELTEFLMAYLDGELPEAQRQEFRRHLEDCPPCMVYLETYEEAVRLGKACCKEPDEAVSEEVPEALVQAILRARER